MAKKTQLGYQEIEKRLKYFKEHDIAPDEVAYRLLYCFGKSDADIRRWQEGKGILKSFDGLLIKNLIAYRPATTEALTDTLERLKADKSVQTSKAKIVAASDGRSIVAYDMREHDTYDNRLQGLYCDFNFFYPLADVERVHNVEESPADVKAAERLAKLHDEIRAFNEFTSDSDLHDLNIFISRLLFCYFAEDTGIFKASLFTNSIKEYTLDDGSDLSAYLSQAFEIMDIPEKERPKDANALVSQFPYVNGGLFRHHIQIPHLSPRARKIMIDCGSLDWKEINPDIFGSMIQAVVNPEVRANQGMHYTSVPNIKKVINPLFMDELRGQYDTLRSKVESLRRSRDIGEIPESRYYKEVQPIHKACGELLRRMGRMKFFDPACGSGNFLIITYKELRLLEMDILRLQQECTAQHDLLMIGSSVISLQQFYGIELLDFPHEVAMLSLWLAEHQMNKKLLETFGINTQALPLPNITQIRCGNACRMDWDEVCPHEKDEEVFVFGNPPYLGTKWQNTEQKADVDIVMNDNPLRRTLDYIACWFVLGAKFINHTKSKYAFVSTNSICQGEQVAALWGYLEKYNICIEYAYTSFKWTNNAKNSASVTCIILGICCNSCSNKRLYTNNECRKVNNINYYLLDAPNIVIEHRRTPLSAFPQMTKGSQPADGGFLILDEDEKKSLLGNRPELTEYIRQYMGADDLLNAKKRYCLWLKECSQEILSLPEIQNRLSNVRITREGSTKESTRRWANKPHLFTEDRQPMSDYLILPVVSSENRVYVPVGINSSKIIANTNSQMIAGAKIYLFGIISSLIHNVWMRAVCGRMKTDYAYSASIVYNTFPFPKLTEAKKKEIEAAAEEVLLVREDYPGATLADLYDPDKMPQPLLQAHQRLDDIVESCYPGYPFPNDEARLECLFKLYEKMTHDKK